MSVVSMVCVAYDNGNVAELFGSCDNFKFYAVSEGRVLRSKVVPVEGKETIEIVSLINSYRTEAVVCGKIGLGALDNLDRLDIAVFAEQEGDADEAIVRLIKGELVRTEVPTCSDGTSCAAHGCTHPCH